MALESRSKLFEISFMANNAKASCNFDGWCSYLPNDFLLYVNYNKGLHVRSLVWH